MFSILFSILLCFFWFFQNTVFNVSPFFFSDVLPIAIPLQQPGSFYSIFHFLFSHTFLQIPYKRWTLSPASLLPPNSQWAPGKKGQHIQIWGRVPCLAYPQEQGHGVGGGQSPQTERAKGNQTVHWASRKKGGGQSQRERFLCQEMLPVNGALSCSRELWIFV